MPRVNAPAHPLVIFLVDVANANSALQPKFISALHRLLAFHCQCPHCQPLWTYQLFDSTSPCVSLQSCQLERLPISPDSSRKFKEDLHHRHKAISSTKSRIISNCSGVVRAIEDIVNDLDSTHGTDTLSVDSFLSDQAEPPSSSTVCAAGHSLLPSIYLLADAPQIAEHMFTSGLGVLPNQAKDRGRGSTTRIPCDPHLDLSSSAKLSQSQNDPYSKTDLKRVLTALLKRRTQFTWIDTDSRQLEDQRVSELLRKFAECLASVSGSYHMLHIDSLFLDERIIPFRSLKGVGEDTSREDFLSPLARGVARNCVEWIEVDMGIDTETLNESNAGGLPPFKKVMSAQFTIGDSNILSRLKRDQSVRENVSIPRLRMILRGYVPATNDAELDKLHAFDYGAGLLRPIPGRPHDGSARHSWNGSVFAGLMTNLAFTRAYMIADVLTSEDGNDSYPLSVLIQPLSASVASVRVIKVQSTRHCRSSHTKPGLRTPTDANEDTFDFATPQTLLLPSDSSDCLFNRFLPGPWTGNSQPIRVNLHCGTRPLMTELKKYSSASSSEELLHMTEGHKNRPGPNGDAAIDGICNILSRNHACVRSEVLLPSGFADDATSPRPRSEENTTLRLPRSSQIKEKHSSSPRRIPSSESEALIPDRVVDVQSSIHEARTTQGQKFDQGPSSVAGGFQQSPGNQSVVPIPLRSVEHVSGPVPIRNKSGNLEKKAHRSVEIGPVAITTPLSTVPNVQPDNALQLSPGNLAPKSLPNQHKSPSNTPSDMLLTSDRQNVPSSFSGCRSVSEDPHMRVPKREGFVVSGTKFNGAELLSEASVHLNRCKSRLMSAQGHNIREEVQVCLSCISSIVEILANREHWESIRGSISNYVQKKTEVIVSLRTAGEDLGTSHQEALDIPPPRFWNAILNALEQVVWQIAEGANCQEQRAPKNGSRKVQRHTRRALSFLSSIQLTAHSIPSQLGQFFFAKVFSDFLQVVLMKFLRGTHHRFFANVLGSIFVDYGVNYSPTCLVSEKEPNSQAGCTPRRHGFKSTSRSSKDHEKESESNSDQESLHSQRKRSIDSNLRDCDKRPDKKPRRGVRRPLNEIMADSRYRNAAKDHGRTHRSRRMLDLGKARNLQQPLAVARQKHKNVK